MLNWNCLAYIFIDFLLKKEYNLYIKIFLNCIYSKKSKKGDEMNTKEIYLKIDNLITEQYRSLKSFCNKTNRSYSSLARTMSDTIHNKKGAHLITTEEILNDLGYELCIRKKESKKI